MKLPKELKFSDSGLHTIVEAIVRDCAKVCINEAIRCRAHGWESHATMADQLGASIRLRYGLAESPTEQLVSTRDAVSVAAFERDRERNLNEQATEQLVSERVKMRGPHVG